MTRAERKTHHDEFRLGNWALVISALALACGLSGCSSLGVEPWQRDVLSQPGMQFDSNGLSANFAQHFYFSKEASSGGQGFAGGGCGCN